MDYKIKKLIKQIQKLANIYGKTNILKYIKEAINVDDEHTHDFSNIHLENKVNDLDNKKYLEEKHYKLHHHEKQ